ncbi:hypothetical protein GCM10010466_28330 [Planomonospora alba]|uniref:Uncharacterized protein n=1 Tax=Planomonospora alba TaxID=161354 RepID=A0ABP6N6F1_9ACTN
MQEVQPQGVSRCRTLSPHRSLATSPASRSSEACSLAEAMEMPRARAISPVVRLRSPSARSTSARVRPNGSSP